MSKAGQNTVTGISAQADISLLKLLESFHRQDFEQILLEDKKWEDFTLIFQSRIESYEVKWHSKPLSYHEVRSIIRKETKKAQSENYSFKIAAKSFSSQFKRDFYQLKEILPYLGVSKGNRPFAKNSLVRKFTKKKWKPKEIAFLGSVEIISLDSNQHVADQIFDLFRYQWDVFLSDSDLQSLVSNCFRTILEKAQTGSSISRLQFAALVNDFEEGLAKKSESFTPTISTATQTKSLEKFLTSPTEFKNLDHEKYLTPLTSKKNRALITYISKKLEANTFSTQDIQFFIDKVLLKSSYLYTCFRLLKLKSNAGLMNPEYFVGFLSKNYNKLANDYVVHDAFELLLSCVKSDPRTAPQVLKFLQSSIFSRKKTNRFLQRADLDYSYKYQHLPTIIEVLGNELQHSEQFINILFKAFDFTGDQFQLPTDTPTQVYSIIKAYILHDRSRRWSKIVKKLGAQFIEKYNLPFKGYEYSGGGVGMTGWHFSFTDTGLVRKLYGPLFREMLAKDPSDFLSFQKNKVFKSKEAMSPSNPIFVKRAAIGPLVEFVSKSLASTEDIISAREMLLQIIRINRGLPSTSDAIFACLRNYDLSGVGHDFVFELIKIDLSKSSQRVPTSIFVVETILKLVDEGYIPAKDLLIEIFGNEHFRSSWRAKEFLSALGNPNILQNNPSLKFELIESFDIKGYLKYGFESNWLNSDFIKNHLRELWKTNPARADAFVLRLLSDKSPSEKILNLLAGALFDLYLEFPDQLWVLFKAELEDKKLFHARFKRSSYFRQSFYRLAQAMLKKKKDDAAKIIVDLLIKDTDPNTNQNKKKHEELKNGASVSSVSGVRTQVPWILQSFAIRKDAQSLQYALNKLQVTLDLNGRLRKELGYYDRDFYVMANSIVPLIELAHPYRRKVLRKIDRKKRDLVKLLSLRVLRFLKKEIDKKKIKPVDVCDYLVRVFHWTRDLNTSEAKLVLDFFEAAGVEDSTPLMIYFSVFRKGQYRTIPFDAKPFKKRLQNICRGGGNIELRTKLSWHFWRTLNEEKIPSKKVVEIDGYVEAFYSISRPTDLAYLSFILEKALLSKSRYNRYFKLMKSVMGYEIEYLPTQPEAERYPRLSLRKIATILRETELKDFFDTFEIIISASDPKTGIGVYGMNLPPFINEFKKIGEVPPILADRHENIRRFLLGIGAIE